MARVCECGRYLGARSTCYCGRTSSDPTGSTQPWDPGLYPDLPPGAPADIGPGSAGASPITAAVRPSWAALEGVVLDAQPAHLGRAGGVVPAQLMLFAVVGLIMFIKGPALVSAITQAVLSLISLFLGPLVVIVLLLAVASRVPGASGCMGVLMHLAWVPGRFGSRPSSAVDGWRTLLETPSGAAEVHLAANASFHGGERLLVHGPAIGGVKHAWLLQSVGPRPFTRVGRGVIGLLLNTFIFVPLVAAFLLAL